MKRYSAMDIAAYGEETQKVHKVLDVVAFVWRHWSLPQMLRHI